MTILYSQFLWYRKFFIQHFDDIFVEMALLVFNVDQEIDI